MSEKSQLIDKLSQNRKLREAYVRSKVMTNVASQIRALRRRRNQTQKEFSLAVGMKQSRISAMEQPGTNLNVETLVRLAAALKAGLMVKFCSYNEMLNWENSFNQDSFNVIDLDADGDFKRQDVPEREATITIGAAKQFTDGKLGPGSAYEENSTSPFHFQSESITEVGYA